MAAHSHKRATAARRTEAPAEPAAASPPFVDGLLLVFFLSGAAALVYQSLWMRRLSLILGSTTYAVGTILAAFMGGLGVGAYVLGRVADRSPRPLRLYAALEVAIGLFGLASPLVLAQGNAVYGFFYARLHEYPGWLTLARFAIGFTFVALPAFLMGGTFPVAARYVVRAADVLGTNIGLLYALNTLGAALGAIALPFTLLPALGVRATLLACGVVNLAIAAAAWIGGRSAAPIPVAAVPRVVPRVGSGGGVARGLLPAFFLSGFVALALEVLWNRFFGIYFGSSLYSYAIILFLYLSGIVIGGALFTVLDGRGYDAGRVFAATLAGLIAVLAVSVPLMDRLLYLQVAILGTLGIGFSSFQLSSLGAGLLVILPPTVLFGMAFPAVAKAASRGVARVGGDLGLVYLVNTAGTTAGALVTSFVLIPWLGVRRSLDVLPLLVGLALLWSTGWGGFSPRRLAGATVLGALALVPALGPSWDARLMQSSPSSNPWPIVHLWRQGSLAGSIAGIQVMEVQDGVDATVSVASYDGTARALLVNGKVDATDGTDMLNQMMLGHLPMLLRPEAKDILVIGMGSGVTLAAVARHPVARMDLVEISPEVLDLGDRHFRAVNRHVLADPRLTVYLEDGRNFIAFNEARAYDVIINEPSNPWMTGVANLFTDEFFREARRRLRPGGLLVQWFHYYNMQLTDIRTLVGTVRGHFPVVYLFAFHEPIDRAGDLLLVAADNPLDFGPAFAALRGDGEAMGDFRRIGVSAPEQLLRGLVLSPEIVDDFVAGAPLNSDDRPRIELDAGRAAFVDTSDENLRSLLLASDGARLAASLQSADDWVPGTGAFELELLEGFELTSNAYRLETGPAPREGLPPRGLVRELAAENAAGGRIVLFTGGGERNRQGLDRLATGAAGGPVIAAGERTVNGHPAVAYRAPGVRGEVVAWTCSGAEASYAVAVVGGERIAAADVLGGFRCHADGEGE